MLHQLFMCNNCINYSLMIYVYNVTIFVTYVRESVVFVYEENCRKDRI